MRARWEAGDLAAVGHRGVPALEFRRWGQGRAPCYPTHSFTATVSSCGRKSYTSAPNFGDAEPGAIGSHSPDTDTTERR